MGSKVGCAYCNHVLWTLGKQTKVIPKLRAPMLRDFAEFFIFVSKYFSDGTKDAIDTTLYLDHKILSPYYSEG